MAAPTLHDVAHNPEWIPHAIEPDGQSLTSVFVPRPSRSELVFLSDGQFRGKFQKVTLPIAALEAEASSAPQAPLHFIFHTSFCCSTLLARALEVPGVASGLREPNILVNLADWLIRTDAAQNRSRLELVARLLSRPFSDAEKVVIKPSSFANRLIEPLLALRPRSRAILLFSEPATYLRSLVRRGLLARINARKLYQNLAAWTHLDFGFSASETFEQTDLQIASLAWLMQISHLDMIAQRFGPERVLVLDSAELLANPATSLERAQSFLGLGLNEEQISEIVNGPTFSKHAKFSELDYDARAREQEHEALMKAHSEELGMVLEWLNAVAAHLGVGLRPRIA